MALRFFNYSSGSKVSLKKITTKNHVDAGCYRYAEFAVHRPNCLGGEERQKESIGICA